ncbi:hypothetical protein RchiOBHm_Chr1g0333121 [Rosa chinensis]|uniref:Uncharacterized protein n=1 Tax=Rosa chinensis TaxID=74649 RepID=A0A2P6SBZ6_ROSCH|nr:uncharacterized protein LOC112190847 [Rosa chinensis]XP_024186132.1 uncharacterized protein LOC112190847 [Rosa chinensis]PRQ56196.1 hypothetical protein RchiOBHm_Chr1g0333121 [Rosa chinensis]
MHNPNQDIQDRRSNSGMEDSPGITIEFLRARLLSERSVSRSARQRAYELEKMVEELEEQLKIVSLQRKMAEKATADVLAILENQGASDISEEFDSSSDQETHQESEMGNNSRKEEESFLISKARRNEHEEHLGSDLDSSSIPGRSLSWKGRIDSPRSREKYKEPSMRRRSTFSAIGSSSSRHNLGKSCRQIKHRESRSVVERFKVEQEKFDDSEENGVAASSEGLPNCSYSDPEKLGEGSESQKEKVLLKDARTGSKEHQRNGDLDFNGHGRNKDMEKALEFQAQLIGQNEEMEKAQREWEENKCRENNTSTPDSCDPGNHSDITEERDEMKASFPAEIAASQAQEAKSEARDACLFEEKTKTQPNGFLPPSDVEMGGMQDPLNRSSVASASPVQEFAFPTAYEKQTQESLENNAHQPSPGSHHDPLLLGSSYNRSSVASSSDEDSSLRNASGSRNDLYALVPHDSQDRLGGVLDALKKAKLSLRQKMTRLPLLDGTSVQESIEPSIPAITSGSRLDIPVGCAGLFRLPTDFAVEEAATKNSYLGLGSSLPSARYFPDKGMAATSTDQFVRSTYIETRPPFSNHVGDRFIASPYVENRQTVSTGAGDRVVASPYVETRRAFSSNVAGQFITNPSIETRPPFSNNVGDRFVTSHYVDTRPTFSTNAGDRYVASPYLDIRPTLSSDAAGRFVTNHKIETRPNFPMNVADQFVTSASGETDFSADNRFLGGNYAESWSRVSTPIPHFDPYLDMSQLSSRYTNSTTYQNYPPFSDPIPWIASDEVLTRPFPRRPAVVPAVHLSSYDDPGRPNMYR